MATFSPSEGNAHNKKISGAKKKLADGQIRPIRGEYRTKTHFFPFCSFPLENPPFGHLKGVSPAEYPKSYQNCANG